MPRTKGSKNKPKTVTADFATQIAEKQSAKEALTAEISSITANIDTLKADLHTMSIHIPARALIHISYIIRKGFIKCINSSFS